MKYLVSFLTLLITDLVVKYALNTSNIESITLIPFFLDFYLTKNTGIALSLFSSSGTLTQIFLTITIFIALMFLVYTFFTTVDKMQKIGLILVLSGGFGNFIERLFFGSVTDYLHLRIGTNSLFVFNLADFFITLGAIIIILVWLRDGRNV
ncbi:MAG: signal peptidase II [SAR86 cluster bacterium]|uniref:Lipoprotein signal peptidase n=1 Tax=SAR86 cluster bacterium TaxID=2030880 RepID=A0A520MSI8_9GAMM|nr:MAG: signal peptidase II [SAR86 cluster bacterium]